MRNFFKQTLALLVLCATAGSQFAKANAEEKVAEGEKILEGDKVVDTVIEVFVSDKNARGYLASMGFALDEVFSDRVYIFGTKSDAERIQKSGFKVQSTPYLKRWKSFDKNLPQRKFVSYSEALEKMNSLAHTRPDLAQVLSLGRSFENRDTPVLRISAKNLGDAETQKLPVIFYMGCHHAREALSVEVPLEFAQYLVANYDKNLVVKRLLNEREIYIAPIVNPDGYVFDRVDGLEGRMWRKNRRPNGDGSKGVDLNRNYGFQWGTTGISHVPSSDTYLGPSPFSEAESQNVKNFVDTQPRLKTLITFHSFAEQILYPWSYDSASIAETHPQWAEDLRIFKKMSEDMASFNGYHPQQSSELYPSSGDTGDWAYAEHRIFAFTIELGPRSSREGGFYPNPDTSISKVTAANLKPMLYLMEYADNPARVLNEELPNFNSSPAKSGVPMASSADLRFY